MRVIPSPPLAFYTGCIRGKANNASSWSEHNLSARVGNTRSGADTKADAPARMRGVKEAVRHIMKDLK
jgi:hypothetical protein